MTHTDDVCVLQLPSLGGEVPNLSHVALRGQLDAHQLSEVLRSRVVHGDDKLVSVGVVGHWAAGHGLVLSANAVEQL